MSNHRIYWRSNLSAVAPPVPVLVLYVGDLLEDGLFWIWLEAAALVLRGGGGLGLGLGGGLEQAGIAGRGPIVKENKWNKYKMLIETTISQDPTGSPTTVVLQFQLLKKCSKKSVARDTLGIKRLF